MINTTGVLNFQLKLYYETYSEYLLKLSDSVVSKSDNRTVSSNIGIT